MSEYGTLDKALPGLLYGIESDVRSGAANAAIDFGAPVFIDVGEDVKVRPFVKDETIVTYDADFVASNSIAASVNGVAITPVVYATSHAATFAALVAALDALSGVDIVSSNATTRVIRLRTKGTTLTFTSTVTLGASQAVATQQASTSYLFGGVALRTAKNLVSGVARYEAKDPVNVLQEGTVWVTTADAVSSQKAVYLTSAGAWTDEVTGNILTPYTFRTSTTGAGLAVIEVSSAIAA